MIHLLEKIRSKLFWFKDSLTGGKLRYHYNDIQSILEDYDTHTSRIKREAYLNRLLNHAVETTSFYENYKDFTSLKDFPIINKLTLVEKYEELQSTSYKYGVIHKMSTSGSSGTPFIMLQDKNKKLRNTADTLYFAKQSGFDLGNRLYYFRRWSKKHKKSKLTSFATNIEMVNVTEFSDEYFANLIQNLEKDTSNKGILGYSSALRELCKYLDRVNAKPVKTNISSIIAMSEALSTYTRATMNKYFNVPIVSRYSNMENGMIAQQFSNMGDDFHINWASYHIELLHPEKDEPVNPGEMGRVVLTDYFNHCMPIIRYDTGDFAVMNKNNTLFNNAPTFSKVEGRRFDIIYDTNGNALTPFIVFEMEAFPELKQFQLIQDGKRNYTIKLNLDGTFHHEKELADRLKLSLGTDAEIKYVYEHDIPELSSGKRRLTANSYIQDEVLTH